MKPLYLYQDIPPNIIMSSYEIMIRLVSNKIWKTLTRKIRTPMGHQNLYEPTPQLIMEQAKKAKEQELK